MLAKFSLPTLCNMFGIGASLLLVLYQAWNEYQYALEHPDVAFCGNASFAALLLGFMFSSAMACLASIFGFYIFKAEGSKHWKLKVAIQAFGPGYFLILASLILMLISELMK